MKFLLFSILPFKNTHTHTHTHIYIDPTLTQAPTPTEEPRLSSSPGCDKELLTLAVSSETT